MKSKKAFLILIVGFLFFQNITLVFSQSCFEKLEIEVQVYEKVGVKSYQKSNYQPTGIDGFVRQGDILFIERVYAKINSSCLPYKTFTDVTLQFKRPGSEDWGEDLGIPLNFEKSLEYSLSLRNLSDIQSYEDSYGERISLHGKTLDEKGVWKIKILDLDSKFYIWNSGRIIFDEIKVMDRVDVIQLQTLRQIKKESQGNTTVVFIMGFITILVGLVSIFIMSKTSKKQIKKMDEQYKNQIKKEDEREEGRQLDLLRTLYTELIFLEKNLESYKETFSKDKHYPFYELWDIEVSLYLKILNHKIRGEETINLKENLMALKDKFIIINNMKLESKKDEEERGEEKLIQIKIESIRKGIIKIISDDLLPLIKKSKKFIKDKWNL